MTLNDERPFNYKPAPSRQAVITHTMGERNKDMISVWKSADRGNPESFWEMSISDDAVNDAKIRMQSQLENEGYTVQVNVQ